MIPYVALVAAIAEGLPAVIRLLKQVGCIIDGCPADEPVAPPPPEHEAFRDAFTGLVEESNGISRR